MISFKGKTLSLAVTAKSDTVTIKPTGDMDVKSLASIEPLLEKIFLQDVTGKIFLWDLEAVTSLDSAAALLIISFNNKIECKHATYELTGNSNYLKIIEAIKLRLYDKSVIQENRLNIVQLLGQATIKKYERFKEFLSFVGRLFSAFFIYIFNPKSIRFKEIYHAIEESGIKSLGIIALTTFLIGVVLAYQSSVQLKMYGANIFIVDMLGVSILRELSPLIAAIVIAGRSGSAFAAQIGVMKITEELDAMRTMGFDPYLFLVLPRIIALMIMMPLIIFFADVMAMLGGMLIAKIELGISAQLFMDRFADNIEMKHFFIGIGKGPFFGFIIASIGIFRGLIVKNDTRSIGINTTKSVVESIFAVIICDAIFSIIFTNMGI
ncbi:MAG: ABC transporter permease [Campylobacterota bacterium]|nr:ABC transporter permease [Campylobacterota bacterium]